MNVDKHKYLMLQILKDLYADASVSAHAGFKGGTALMLFHGLPRFSVDLDFNITGQPDAEELFRKIRQILERYGRIRDEALKRFGFILVLDYGESERNLKIEASNREFPDRYELRDYLGISLRVMVLEDMFTHKLAAILDRDTPTNRDIFDCWYCMNRRILLNKNILDKRLNCPLEEYLEKCKDHASKISSTRILNGLGELMEPGLKDWVKKNLVKEFILQADLYKNLKMTL